MTINVQKTNLEYGDISSHRCDRHVTLLDLSRAG